MNEANRSCRIAPRNTINNNLVIFVWFQFICKFCWYCRIFFVFFKNLIQFLRSYSFRFYFAHKIFASSKSLNAHCLCCICVCLCFFFYYHAITEIWWILNERSNTSTYNWRLTEMRMCTARNRFKKWTTAVTLRLLYLCRVSTTPHLSYSVRVARFVCIDLYVCWSSVAGVIPHSMLLFLMCCCCCCCCLLLFLFICNLLISYVWAVVLRSIVLVYILTHRQNTLFLSTYLCYCAYIRKL